MKLLNVLSCGKDYDVILTMQEVLDAIFNKDNQSNWEQNEVK